MLMAKGGVGNPSGLPVKAVSCFSQIFIAVRLVEDVVPEESVDHVSHRYDQGGAGDVERPQLQLSGPFFRRQAGQLDRSQCSDNFVGAGNFRLAGKYALDQKIVDFNVRVGTAVLDHDQVVVQIGPVTDSR